MFDSLQSKPSKELIVVPDINRVQENLVHRNVISSVKMESVRHQMNVLVMKVSRNFHPAGKIHCLHIKHLVELTQKIYSVASHIAKAVNEAVVSVQIYANVIMAFIKTIVDNVFQHVRSPVRMAGVQSLMYVHAIRDMNWTKRISINALRIVQVHVFKVDALLLMYVIVIQVRLIF